VNVLDSGEHERGLAEFADPAELRLGLTVIRADLASVVSRA